jgi:hypothetical protein
MLLPYKIYRIIDLFLIEPLGKLAGLLGVDSFYDA